MQTSASSVLPVLTGASLLKSREVFIALITHWNAALRALPAIVLGLLA